MSWSASVLSTVSSDTEPSIVITFENAKYLFNAGENTGRAWLQSRQYWRKTKGIFLTSVGTQRGSGLPGLLMFLADAGIPSVDVAGPRGLTHFLASMRTYLFRSNMAVTTIEAETPAPSNTQPDPIFRDDNLTVYGFSLSPSSDTVAAQDDHSSNEVVADAAQGKRRRSASPESRSKRTRLDSSLSLADVSVRDHMAVPEFSPTLLTGNAANEWRKLAVASMFPAGGRSLANIPKPQKCGKAENKTENKSNVPFDSSIDDIQDEGQQPFSYSPGLPHRDRQLPHYQRQESMETLCYVCVGPRVRGKFHADKAKALQIPKGPLMGKLTKGETITFMINDGNGGQMERTVKPEDCVDPPEVAKVVLILDVPSPKYIPSAFASFEDSPFYSQFRSKTCDDYSVHAVFHLCGRGVLEDTRYREFMGGFGDSVHHLIASREHAADRATFTSAALNQLRLNQLDEKLFPIPKVQLVPSRSLSTVPELPTNTIGMTSNMLLNIRPPQAPMLDQQAEIEDGFHAVLTSSTELILPPLVATAFKAAKETVSTMERPPRPGDDVMIVPLGTSSAAPTKYRNVSGTLIEIPGCGNILLDAGEGTWGQLVRIFGDDSAGVWQVLRDLKCIFISHIHGDHHIGLAKILAMRCKLDPPPTEPIYVVGVRSVLLYLQELSEIEDLGLARADGTGVITILADALNWRDRTVNNRYSQEPWMHVERSCSDAAMMCRGLGLQNFTTVDVRHRTRCYGVVIKHTDNWSIVYSGDTMPTENLVQAGANATLLIHEATMGDDQEELAQLKAHSTFSQAVDIGNRMGAENILLTHFSARYPKMPPASIVSHSNGPTLALAFDQTRMPIGDMAKLSVYLPAIEQNFVDTREDDEISE